MTLLEYVQSLQEQGATDIPDKVQEWKRKNQPKVEEEVKTDPVVETKTDATVAGKSNGASENLDSGDLALNVQFNEPDNNILFGWQEDIIKKPEEPGTIGELDIDLSLKPLGEITKNLEDDKKELYGDVEFIPGEIKKGKGGFEYKYEIVEKDGKRQREFYFKGANDNDWINQSKKLKENPKSDVLGNQMVGVLSELGFMSEKDGEEAYKNQEENKKIRALNQQSKEYNNFQKEINNHWKNKEYEQKNFIPLKPDESGGFYNRNKDLENRLGKSITTLQDQYEPGFYSDFYINKKGDDKIAFGAQEYLMSSYGITNSDSSLPKILGPDLSKKFFGYLNKNKLAKEFTENAMAGNFGIYGVGKGMAGDVIFQQAAANVDKLSGGGDTGPKAMVKAEVARQRRLSTYLSNFLLENKTMEDNKLLDGYAALNPSEFKGINNIIVQRAKARSLISKLNWNKRGFTSFNSTDFQAVKVYMDNFFPELKAANDKIELERTQRIAEIQNEGSWDGTLSETINSMEDNVMSRAMQYGNLVLSDVLGFDTRFSLIQQAETKAQEIGGVKKPFVNGKTATIDGKEYVLEDNIIYEAATNTPILQQDALVPGSMDMTIKDVLEGSKETTTSFSGSASVSTTAGALTGLAVDIYGTKGIGKVTGLLAKVNKGALGLVKLPQARLDGMLYWSGLGYAQGKLETYQQLVAAGISEAEAGELSDQAAIQTGVLYGAAGIFSPTEKYFGAFQNTLNLKNQVKNAVTQLTNKGNKKSWGEIFKSLMPTKAGTFNTVKNAGGEMVEETSQESVTSLVINENINQQIGREVLDAEFTTSDLATTLTVSAAVSSAATNIKIPGSTSNHSQLNASLFMMGKNPAGTKKALNNLVSNGEITQEQSSILLKQVKAITNQVSKIPNFVSPKSLLEISMLSQDIEDLKARKKKENEAFHPKLDQLIEEKQKKLAEVVKPEIENSLARKGAKKAADQMGNIEFETFSDQESIDNRKKELEKKGAKVQKSVGYGEAIELDGKTIILINDQVAAEDNVYTTDQHEVLHPFFEATFKNNPELAIRFGKSLMAEIINNPEITGGAQFISRFQQYLNDPEYTAEMTWEEVIPLFSESLSNGDIVYNKKQDTWWQGVGKQISELFSSSKTDPLNIRFDTGKDVADFIMGYNQSIESGEGLTETQLKVAKEGAKGNIVDGTNKIDGRTKGAKLNKDLDAGMAITPENEVDSKESKRIYQEVELMKPDLLDPKKKKNTVITAAYSLVEEAKRRMRNINLSEDVIDDIARTFALNDKRGLIGLISNWTPKRNDSVMGYLNSKSASGRSLFDARLQEFYEADPRYNEIIQSESQEGVKEKMERQTAEEQRVDIVKKPIVKKIKPSSLISTEAVTKIKEQIETKIGSIDPKNLTFKKLGDLAPEIIAAEIGIPVKKLTVPAANLSKGDATAIQQFVNKNADKLLKILPQGAVVEAATEKLLGTSTGVPKGLLDAFYTKKARLGKGAGLAPFVLNKGINKAQFLEAFGIVDGKKQEGFNARSSQAQALKGIASLYGKLVTNEIVRSDTDLSLETKQDVAAGKNKVMASKRFNLADAKNISSTAYTVKLDKKINTRLTSKGKKVKIKVTDLDSEKMKKFTTVVNDFLKINPAYGPYFRQGYTGTKQTHTYGEVDIFDKYVPGFKGIKKLITRLAYSKSRFQSKKTIDKAIPTLKADNKARMDMLKNMALDIEAFLAIEGNKDKAYVFEQFFKDGSRDQNHPLRYLIPLKFATVNPLNLSLNVNEEVTEEHTSPVVGIGRLIMDAAKNGNVEQVFTEVIEPGAAQGGLLRSIDEDMSSALKQDQANEFYDTVLQLNKEGKLDSVKDALWYIRYSIENSVNPFSLMLLENGVTVGEYFLGKTEISKAGLIETQEMANEFINKILTGKITQKQAKKQFQIQQNQLLSGKVMASKRDSGLIPDAIKYDKPTSVQTAINALEKTDKALNNARKLDAPVKKIRVFDFDDTLAKSKSMVIVTMPNGSIRKINATQFAQQAADLESQGVEFDFTEFSKVVEGKKGPLFEVAQKIADARGTEDVFILTARPQAADGPIKAFMKANGIDIPLKNITGLGEGTPQAKAGWIMGKAAQGYNDFYFADDAIKNVQAVKDVLSQIDVKSEVQLAKASKRVTFDTIVNDMIEDSASIKTYKQYSAARAKTIGASKGRFNFLIPASAEDFTGLLYKMLGKGKKGDAQMAFLKNNLLDPYDRAETAVTQAKIAAANDFKALKQNLKTLPNSLSKSTGIAGFTFSHAVRVAIWSKQGMNIPGLSKRDIKELNNFVNNNAELSVFTDELMKIQKGKSYPKPGDNWLGGNITGDIINDINKVNRAEYQQEWRENVDIIFSEDNMNKMEAAYGTRWREAMEDSLRRMKSGSNRPPGGNRATDGILDWLNNSVGAVMFLNTRSALLQTISAVNFINWGDNNIVKAGLAFANQKQFWGDFMTLMNSDYLVERRNGLKINVSESEIADAVRDSDNKVKAAIAFLLSKGFVMTRFADSFAIATGGSTFYRNRVKALVGKGMEQKAAEAQAFEDFRQIAEESQQSSNPNRISQQQASGAGRVILAWANTPMQYARIQKRAAQDLINGRGDWKTNVSKIVYYGAIQNLIFNSLQQAVFALAFGEDDDEEQQSAKKNEKISRVANGMIDSQLKGLGIGGAAVVALKSALMELGKQHSKDRPKYEEAVFDLLGFSPVLGSKVQKINSGLRSFSWNMKDMKEKGFSLDNPAYLAGAQIATGLTNLPLDRVVKKINNVRGIVNEQSAHWQKVALGLGWSTWDVGLGYYGGFDAAKVLTADEEKVKEIDDMKKLTKTQEQVDMLLDLGLTKKEIKALGKEQSRVEKIIELQNAEAKPKEEAKVKEEIKEETKPKPKPTPKVKVKPKVESAEKRLRRQFDSIKDENKPDQVKTLLGFGLTKAQIRELKYEKNRVEKILELMPKNK